MYLYYRPYQFSCVSTIKQRETQRWPTLSFLGSSSWEVAFALLCPLLWTFFTWQETDSQFTFKRSVRITVMIHVNTCHVNILSAALNTIPSWHWVLLGLDCEAPISPPLVWVCFCCLWSERMLLMIFQMKLHLQHSVDIILGSRILPASQATQLYLLERFPTWYRFRNINLCCRCSVAVQHTPACLTLPLIGWYALPLLFLRQFPG